VNTNPHKANELQGKQNENRSEHMYDDNKSAEAITPESNWVENNPDQFLKELKKDIANMENEKEVNNVFETKRR
jgi:hypothetical protein